MKLSKEQKELWQRCDEVLHYQWDPCGVQGEPAARDEYSSYLPGVFRVVLAGKKKAVAQYLMQIEEKRMTGSRKEFDYLAIAETLISYRDWLIE